jgi:hypothetical protein
VQAAAFAAMLVPLASVAAHGSTITCGFGGSGGGPCAVGSGGASRDRIFDFGPYSVEIAFSNTLQEFDVSITDLIADQSSFTGDNDRFDGLPGFQCVSLVDPQTNVESCRIFEVTTDPGAAAGGTGFFGNYAMTIQWDFDSNALFPDDGGLIRLLHDSSQVPGDLFADITTPGTYESEPSIGGGDYNFQDFTVAQAPAVPEPATVFLVGTGIAAAYRRRRKR